MWKLTIRLRHGFKIDNQYLHRSPLENGAIFCLLNRGRQVLDQQKASVHADNFQEWNCCYSPTPTKFWSRYWRASVRCFWWWLSVKKQRNVNQKVQIREIGTYNVKNVVTPRRSLRGYLDVQDLTYRIKTSPRAPFDFPSWYSSVFASYQYTVLVLLK